MPQENKQRTGTASQSNTDQEIRQKKEKKKKRTVTTHLIPDRS